MGSFQTCISTMETSGYVYSALAERQGLFALDHTDDGYGPLAL